MISNDQWTVFFAVFSRAGILKNACKAADIGRRTVYDKIAAAGKPDASDEDKAWLARYRDAELDCRDTVLEEIHRRAVEGYDEPVFGREGPIGTVRKYSDALLIRLGMARLPEMFKDRVAKEISGPGGGPIQTEGKVIVIPAISEESPE